MVLTTHNSTLRLTSAHFSHILVQQANEQLKDEGAKPPTILFI